ncbi:MAG: YccF domain-containing protein [Gammaproteobacteria bacterium]|nr:YccF domain-containing protein [Gammaproteobacteria bacterium]NND60656.1 YccF domain-containing protein [Gammaproteobacteria bacterium]
MNLLAILLNVLWIVAGGGIAGVMFWAIAGLLLAITIIGLPFAIAAFRMARFALLPFGQKLVPAEAMGERRVPGTALANILWFILAGVWLWIYHVVVGIFLCLTIIGIPFGIANFKLASVSLRPLGRRAILHDQLMPVVER